MLPFGIPYPQTPFCDPNGFITREWYTFLSNLFQIVGSGQTTTIQDVQSSQSMGKNIQSDIKKLSQQITDLENIFHTDRRVYGANVSANNRVASGRIDGP